MTNTYWRDKHVLVTGGTGFLGSHLVEKLRATYRDVYTTHHNQVDLRSEREVEWIIASDLPSMIIHLAANVGGIGLNHAKPADLFYDNLKMGMNIINSAHLNGVEKVVIVGTVCSYPKHAPTPFHVSSLWDGYPEETNAPYGIAKKALLVMGQAYRQQYGFNVIHLLPTNLYGERDDFSENGHVVPAIIRKCVEAKRSGNECITLWGDGSPTRDFLYAGDAANAIIRAAEGYDSPEPLNVGSGVEVSIEQLASAIMKATGYEGVIRWDVSKPNGQPRRVLDSSEAERVLGWTANMPLEDGLRRTIDWYLANE